MIVRSIPLTRITVSGRTRQEMRNIGSLANSIRDRGLLQPIVVRPAGDGYQLVAGGRRIEAHRLLGLAAIDANVAESLADELEALLAEGEENTEREAFTPTEAVEHAERIRGVEEERAAERRREAARRAAAESAKARSFAVDEKVTPLFVQPGSAPEPSGKFPEGSQMQPPGRTAQEKAAAETRNRVAKATGMSGRTLEKARHVVEAARDPEVPELVREAAREAQAAMDRTGKVDPAFKKVKQAETAAQLAPVEGVLEATGAADELLRLQWRTNFQRELGKAFGLIGMFRAEQVAASADEAQMNELRDLAASLADWVGRINTLREKPQGLSLVVGG